MREHSKRTQRTIRDHSEITQSIQRDNSEITPKRTFVRRAPFHCHCYTRSLVLFSLLLLCQDIVFVCYCYVSYCFCFLLLCQVRTWGPPSYSSIQVVSRNGCHTRPTLGSLEPSHTNIYLPSNKAKSRTTCPINWLSIPEQTFICSPRCRWWCRCSCWAPASATRPRPASCSCSATPSSSSPPQWLTIACNGALYQESRKPMSGSSFGLSLNLHRPSRDFDSLEPESRGKRVAEAAKRCRSKRRRGFIVSQCSTGGN